jgi:hypothetical protein
MTFGLSGSIVNANKVFSGADSDVTGLLQWASAVYAGLIQAQPANAHFTASIAGTTMTVTAVQSGALATNQFIYNSTITGGSSGIAPGTYITAGPGGGPGTYTVNTSQTVAAESMTAYGPDVVNNFGLAQGTMQAWLAAEQAWVKANNVAAVPTPPPLGWT